MAGIVCVFVNIPFGSFWFKKWDPVFMRENRKDDKQLAELGRVAHLVRPVASARRWSLDGPLLDRLRITMATVMWLLVGVAVLVLFGLAKWYLNR